MDADVLPSKQETESVVDSWITEMLGETPTAMKAQRLAVNEDYEKLLSTMDLSRPEGLGLGAELTHGRLVSSMSPADKLIHKSLKRGAQQNRREELRVLEKQKAKEDEEEKEDSRVSAVTNRKVKIQKKQQVEVKKRRPEPLSNKRNKKAKK